MNLFKLKGKIKWIVLVVLLALSVCLFSLFVIKKSDIKATTTVRYPIKVLEIEPSGAVKYNNYNGAKKILKWLGITNSKMTSSNYKNYVEITTLPSNGFIGVNGDVKNIYDLIIISDYNPSGYMPGDAIQGNGIYGPSGKYLMLNLARSGTHNNFYAAMSGNDLTIKSLLKLEEYIDAGKPLILADSIINSITKDTSTTNTNYDVNMYKLSKYILEKNGHNTSNIANENNESAKLNYILCPKVVLDSKFKASYRNNIISQTKIDASTLGYFLVSGYVGSVSDTYDFEVLIDKNGDGILSKMPGEEYEVYYSSIKSYDNKITTDKNGHFEFSLALPQELRGYVGIKVIATNSDGISGEATGSFIVGEEKKEEVKVLQIVPLDNVSNGNFLLAGTEFQNKFRQVEDVVGISLDVDTVSTNTFNSWYRNINYRINSSDYYDSKKNKLMDYDMVVIGFYDNFNRQDISDEDALNNLEDYINMGNSVLFTHDNFIYSAYSDDTYENIKVDEVSSGKSTAQNLSTAFKLTSRFRELAGMDRYGVSNKDKISVAGNNKSYAFNDNFQGYTNLFMMRRGSDNGNAYKLYTNIENKVNSSVLTTTTVTCLNKGQITEYPYNIDDKISVSKTHSQWFTLDLESSNSKFLDSSDDVVVWYSLYSDSNSSYYNLSGADALNNYYIYSKNNITYSGCGHSAVTGDAEIELFVNTVVKAIKSGNSAPVSVVASGVKINKTTYEQAIRITDINSEDPLDTASNYVRFTPSDIDMGISNGAFPYGLAFWDVDNDGSYDANIDVIIKEYKDGDYLRNNIETAIDLRDYLDLTNGQNETLRDAINKGTLNIGVITEDAYKSRGTAIIKLSRRDLFNLD